MYQITFAFEKDGGFVAHDAITGRCAYAFPSSEYAVKAKKDAARTALQMIHTAADPMAFPLVKEYANRCLAHLAKASNVRTVAFLEN